VSNRWLVLTLVFPFFVALSVRGARAQWRTPWTYEGLRGADHWSDLDPDYQPCNTGREQSPIDIRVTERAALPALQFEYRRAPLKYLINNGKTIRVNYHDSGDAGSVLAVGEKRYRLTQFHFHRPSEERVRGKQYDMVVHLMHEASDHTVAGVTVFLKAGEANSTVRQLWDHMPVTEGPETEIPGVTVDPAGLLPQARGYYTYKGSLTAPPCTEGVTWFVLKTPMEISSEQIAAFAQLYPHDVRPPQPLNGRVVRESR
jgi:carbonic anhydrase